jgi:hypothetical protein
MLRSTVILLSLLLLSVETLANVAVTYSAHDKPYFTLEIPDLWRVSVGSEAPQEPPPEGEVAPPRVITVMPNDDSILWFGTWVPEYLHSLDAAQEYLSSLDEFLVDEPTLVKTDDVNLNDMPARYFKGKGKKNGDPVDFFVMLFELSQENIGIAIYIGPPETTNTHLLVLRGMMKSITPVRESK